MMFKKGTTWRHRNHRDVFYKVQKIDFHDAKRYKLKGTWCVQGIDSWWPALQEKVTITSDQWESWYPYTPKGELLL